MNTPSTSRYAVVAVVEGVLNTLVLLGLLVWGAGYGLFGVAPLIMAALVLALVKVVLFFDARKHRPGLAWFGLGATLLHTVPVLWARDPGEQFAYSDQTIFSIVLGVAVLYVLALVLLWLYKPNSPVGPVMKPGNFVSS